MTNEKSSNRLLTRSNSFLGLLLIIGIAIAINSLVAPMSSFRADLTEEKLYTLSEGSLDMLKELQTPTTLKLYFSKGPETPMPLKQYAQRINDLLREYENHGNGKIIVETYNPKPDSDEEEWAQKYGLASQGGGMFGGDAFYLGLVGVAGTKEAAIPFIAPNIEPQLEYTLTRLIHEVNIEKRSQVGILSALPVMGTAPQQNFMMQQPQQPPQPKWTFVTELERQYDVREIPADSKSIPDDLDALLVVHPKGISEETVYAIDQYVVKGGRLIAFVDPMCLTDMQANPPSPYGGPPQMASDLNRLTSSWGFTLESTKLAADPKATTQIAGPGNQPENSPVWLSIRKNQLDKEDIAMSSLELVMLPFGGYFDGAATNGITATPLMFGSDASGSVPKMTVLMGGQSALNSLLEDPAKPYALRLQGKFNSAFPEGLPNAETPAADLAHQNDASEEGLVVLVSDADMLADNFTVRRTQMMGQVIAQPFNDNLNFVLNLAEQATGSQALIGLRSRGIYERPFHKVQELERIAQAKFQAEELQMQQKLQEAQQRITALQSNKSQDQQFILSPEQEAELEKFQDEVFQTRRALKDVRKNLRADIEALGLKIKLLNMAGVPLLVAIFGIVRGLRRKNNYNK